MVGDNRCRYNVEHNVCGHDTQRHKKGFSVVSRVGSSHRLFSSHHFDSDEKVYEDDDDDSPACLEEEIAVEMVLEIIRSIPMTCNLKEIDTIFQFIRIGVKIMKLITYQPTEEGYVSDDDNVHFFTSNQFISNQCSGPFEAL